MDGATDRRKEVVNICLKEFIDRGLYGTTTRDLTNAMNLQAGSLYYYFASKDEVVVACAEEAALQLENELILTALKNVDKPEIMMSIIRKKATEMAPIMKFLTQVCTTPKYHLAMEPELTRLSLRYRYYAKKFGKAYGYDTDFIEPFVYMTITVVVNYMIFGEETYIEPQFNYLLDKIKMFSKSKGQKGVSDENQMQTK